MKKRRGGMCASVYTLRQNPKGAVVPDRETLEETDLCMCVYIESRIQRGGRPGRWRHA